MIRFLAEIAQRFNRAIHLTPVSSTGETPSNLRFPKNYNIYELDISQPPQDSYWTAWGGYYDNFTGNEVELYFGRFLSRVNTPGELKTDNNNPYFMYVIHGVKAYVNIPKHPWLYSGSEVEAENVLSFLSSALNENNPSNNIMRGINIPVRLEIPSLSVKLSDNISGIILNQNFQLSLHNNDGHFDDDISWNLFNTPVRIKKAIVEKPEYEDFKLIRAGVVENAVTGFENYRIDAADRQRAMDGQVCGIITKDMFPGVSIDEKSLNKNIPIVYGKKRISLIKLNDTQFVAAEYVSEVIAVYDKDGVKLPPPTLDKITNIITSTKEAETAVIKGYTANKISEIITDLMNRKTEIFFSETNWNKLEYERYNETSPRLNIIIDGGTVNNAIQTVLKSDMAFLIQQNDGRFTIRKFGTEYATHRIPSTMITRKPEKTWAAAQRDYFSSCIINYGFDGDEYKSLLYDDMEYEAEDTYRRRVRKTFDTDLFDEQDAVMLAEKLGERYATMKQTLKLAAGVDVSGFELLDRVVFDGNINSREFSDGLYFIIKEIDPAQDTLTLEEIFISDITGEYPHTDTHVYDIDNLYADTPQEDFKYLIEGGVQ